ncbi:MAG: TIGR01777 family oxidoreductase [Candidatus Omnitrophota bacterium]|nr:TIGR01777 family oxidoreductase [Candidatus Omnitrophota bacterium]MDZ4241192.1 TIGR01777 family oxidoreductase [Candidatus Omnitrophota bacterium]
MALNVAITGSTGFIGQTLVSRLRQEGHTVTRFLRPGPRRVFNEQTADWDPEQGMIDVRSLENQDIVIHLSGASIAGHRWTPSYKRAILDSRVNGTQLLSKTIARLAKPPKVLLSASAVGFYGPHPPDRAVDESAPRGRGVLADVCAAWESATAAARIAGIRVVNMRIGMVLGPSGGALAKMLPPFWWGLGGPLGNGRQMMSWIALDDIPSAVMHLIRTDSLEGPVNLVSPKPVSNREFTKILARVIRRPAVLPVPPLAIKALFGQMGEELLLSGAAIYPRRLMDTGYEFHFPDVTAALKSAMETSSVSQFR